MEAPEVVAVMAAEEDMEDIGGREEEGVVAMVVAAVSCRACRALVIRIPLSTPSITACPPAPFSTKTSLAGFVFLGDLMNRVNRDHPCTQGGVMEPAVVDVSGTNAVFGVVVAWHIITLSSRLSKNIKPSIQPQKETGRLSA